SRAATERTMHPSTAFAPPDRPVPAARVTTGIRCSFANRTVRMTSSTLRARTSATGAPAGASGAWSREYDARMSGSVCAGQPSSPDRIDFGQDALDASVEPDASTDAGPLGRRPRRDAGTEPRCVGIDSTCGADHNAFCCASAVVPGGTFKRDYDITRSTGDGYP